MGQTSELNVLYSSCNDSVLHYFKSCLSRSCTFGKLHLFNLDDQYQNLSSKSGKICSIYWMAWCLLRYLHISYFLTMPCWWQCGVPLGSIIAPHRFTYCSNSIGQKIHQRSVLINANDVVIFDFQSYAARWCTVTCALFQLSQRVRDGQSWKVSNKLLMNPDKTLFISTVSNSSPLISKTLKYFPLLL